MTKHGVRYLLAAAALWFPLAASASVLTVNECLEGSDFIVNAARARDNGMSRDAFLRQMQEDFALIKAFPPELRWFVKDADDEVFLFEAARAVFDRPLRPEDHRARFLDACFTRTGT